MREHYLATLEQGIGFLKQLNNAQYGESIQNHSSSIGAHTRHILDHFNATKNSLTTGIVDYETRLRGTAIESDIQTALMVFDQLKQWVSTLSAKTLEQPVTVRSDIGIGSQKIVEVQSTAGRELMFSCSHAIHHYATLKTLYQSLGGSCSKQFGLAPSTATFIRQQALEKKQQCAH